LVSDDAIVRGEFAVWEGGGPAASAERRPYLIDHFYFISMNLLGGKQWPTPKADRVPNFAMCGVKTLQYFGFII